MVNISKHFNAGLGFLAVGKFGKGESVGRCYRDLVLVSYK